MAANLTDTAIRSIKPQAKPFKLFDGEGMFLLCTPKGSRLWRLKYRFEGKEKLLALGAYPAVSLKDARKLRDEAKELLAKGIDPSKQKKEAKAEAIAAAKDEALTFRAVSKEWLELKKDTYAASNTKKKQWLIDSLCKYIGEKPISKIVPSDILAAIRPVEATGHNNTAHQLAQTAGQICRFARTCGYAVYNPADGLIEALKPIQEKHFATLTDPNDVGHLLRCIDEYQGSISVMYALKILPYVALRSTELRGARWTEIDLDNAIWTVPASRKANPKDGGGMKMRIAHEVPLPTQVIQLFSELKYLTGNGELCFPGYHSASQCITDAALLNSLRRMGFQRGEMTIHGFRAMFSTMLNEKKLAWGLDSDIIEAQLAHREKNSVRGAYNHASYLEQRRTMLQQWADYLDELKGRGEHYGQGKTTRTSSVMEKN